MRLTCRSTASCGGTALAVHFAVGANAATGVRISSRVRDVNQLYEDVQARGA